MIFYHGTDLIITVINFSKSRLRTDFGRGFYLSDKLSNARDWAVDKSGIYGIPTVMRYEVADEIFQDMGLNRLRFESPTVEWLNFVRDNRRKNVPGVNRTDIRHSYDLVSGPIADDKVAIAVDKYCRGLLTVEETIDEMRTIKDVFQSGTFSLSQTTYPPSKLCYCYALGLLPTAILRRDSNAALYTQVTDAPCRRVSRFPPECEHFLSTYTPPG